jgi:DNA-binding transcriptional LysR family regulator
VSDSARTLSDRTVGLLAGQPRIAVPSMPAKIACQVAGLGHGFLPRACVEGELARGTLVELQTEEPRAPEAFWLGWKTGLMGEALKWWVKQLNRQLVPALLPRSV